MMTISDGGVTAVAIDRDKNSQKAVKWVVENLDVKNSGMILVHVRTQKNSQPQELVSEGGRAPSDSESQQFFIPYRGFCIRKGVRAMEVILHDLDVSSALVNFIHNYSVSTIVLGASSRSAIARAFRYPDVPTTLGKLAPDFCTVYTVAKDRVQNVRSASRPATPTGKLAPRLLSPAGSAPNTPQDHDLNRQGSWMSASTDTDGGLQTEILERNNSDIFQSSPLHSANNSRSSSPKQYAASPRPPSSQSPSPEKYMTHDDITETFSPLHESYYANLQFGYKGSSSPHHSSSGSSYAAFGPPSFQSSVMSYDPLGLSMVSDASMGSITSQAAGELEEELNRLRNELKQTMEMYNTACNEAMNARKKAREIDEWKSEESWKLEEAKEGEEAALAMVEMERHKCKVAIEAAHMAQRLAELEAQKRKTAEERFQHVLQERKRAMEQLIFSEIRYRRYSIEDIEIATDYFNPADKIGEGGYGPVFRGHLYHTPVAIKVLRPDISQGQKQFHREVEVLSSMRHPNLVLLLGACPEYGCLVYEFLENGSLEDRLFRRNRTPPIPWHTRFTIAAEIATALLFLHQSKPEPLVHRDLKPANILLDKNYVSKIGDVGLARLVPASSSSDALSQYTVTAAAGTFCYIDPEYQQTGKLGTKSDLYSLGMILLQILTARPPMGLSHHVENAIEAGDFEAVLDPTVNDWPVEEALSLAKLALHCCELRRRDRPDLASVILPELNRLAELQTKQ